MIKIPSSFNCDLAARNLNSFFVTRDDHLETLYRTIHDHFYQEEEKLIRKKYLALWDTYPDKEIAKRFLRTKSTELRNDARVASIFIMSEFFNCSYGSNSDEYYSIMDKPQLLSLIPAKLRTALFDSAKGVIQNFVDNGPALGLTVSLRGCLLNLNGELYLYNHKGGQFGVTTDMDNAKEAVRNLMRAKKDGNKMAEYNLAVIRGETQTIEKLAKQGFHKAEYRNVLWVGKKRGDRRNREELMRSYFDQISEPNRDIALDLAKSTKSNEERLLFLTAAAKEGSQEAFNQLANFHPKSKLNDPAKALSADQLIEVMEVMKKDPKTKRHLFETDFINKFMVKRTGLFKSSREVISGFEDLVKIMDYFDRNNFSRELPCFNNTLDCFQKKLQDINLFRGFKLARLEFVGRNLEIELLPNSAKRRRDLKLDTNCLQEDFGNNAKVTTKDDRHILSLTRQNIAAIDRYVKSGQRIAVLDTPAVVTYNPVFSRNLQRAGEGEVYAI
jgi:hypothetical protein